MSLDDAQRLAEIVREVAAQGTAVIYISHRIEELRPLAHRLVLQVVARQPANSERSLGLTVMGNILTAHPDIRAVFATNDQMALGAVEAIAARRPQGAIAIIGFDATAEAVQTIIEGRMSASVAQRPFEMGRRSVEAALALLERKTVDARIDSGTELVASENAERFKK